MSRPGHLNCKGIEGYSTPHAAPPEWQDAGLEDLTASEAHRMTPEVIFFLSFEILAGLALFILGMNIMTDGLKQTAGSSLRAILA